MNARNIRELHHKIEESICKHELINAFDNLNNMIVQLEDSSYKFALNELFENYKNMLYYLFEDIKDPEQENVYNDIKIKLFEFNDQVAYTLLLPTSPEYFFDINRVERMRKNSLESLIHKILENEEKIKLIQSIHESINNEEITLLNKDNNNQLINLFKYLFSSFKMTINEFKQLSDFFDNKSLSAKYKSISISAIFLSLLFFFDITKIRFLIERCKDNEKEVKVRAITAIIIIIQLYNNRLKLYSQITSHLAILSDDLELKELINQILIQLIRARDTERISKKMAEEIIPEMLKFSKLSKNKINLDDVVNEKDFLDKNPDWQKEIKNLKLDEKLQEYAEMQSEGFDVFHSTFSTLKVFPFFNEMSNWFLPFDKSHIDMQSITNGETNSLLNLAIFDSPQMCNSDKYSFYFSLLQAPEAHRAMLLNSMGGDLEQMKSQMDNSDITNHLAKESILSNQYIQDLYRFFKINRRKNEFLDIFQLDLNFEKDSLLSCFLSIENLKEIGNYCFNKNLFQVALNLFDRVVKEDEHITSIIWQKKGYCHQMLGMKKDAIEAYLMADILDPDNNWTLRKIAQLYKSDNNFEKALTYYNRLSQLNPTDLNVELNIGHCYYELKDYDLALNCYYKVELIDKKTNQGKALRAIAWISFLQDKFDISENYYSKVLADSPLPHDYLNIGHLFLVQKKLRNALNNYIEAIKLLNEFDEFENIFNADKEILEKKGVNSDLMNYLFDKIKLSIKENNL